LLLFIGKLWNQTSIQILASDLWILHIIIILLLCSYKRRMLNSEELMEPYSKAPNSAELIQGFRDKGNICFKNKKFQDAIGYYEQGLLLCCYVPLIYDF